MAEITATVTAITKMMIGHMEAVPLDAIVLQPILNSVRHLVEQFANFASHLETTKWGDKHGFPPLVLSEDKMRLAAGYNNLDCKWLAKPNLLNPRIEGDTKGRKLLQLQEDQKVE